MGFGKSGFDMRGEKEIQARLGTITRSLNKKEATLRHLLSNPDIFNVERALAAQKDILCCQTAINTLLWVTGERDL